MKTLLVGINSKFIHSNLAVRYLKAYTKKLNYESEILEVTINDSIENIVRAIILKKPNIVGFSTYIWNLEYVEKISRIIKEIDSNIEIFYGGPEVSYDSLSFLSNSAGDYVIEGEGEETFYEFMKNKINGDSLNSIKGLYIKNQDGSINYAGQRALIDMNSIVFPYNDKDDLKNKIVYYEASRGCPFRCKYCLSSTTHGVRFLPVERVKRELKFLIDQDVKLIKFVDRTFNCNSKFAMEIWRFLIEEGSNTCFHFEISADILKHEEIELLAKAKNGQFQFEVGVQTTNNEVLKNINRFVNFDDIKEKVIELESIKNIKQHLDLIAGLPGEDLNSFKKSFDDVYSIKPEEIQLGFLKLLKGSSMREEAEKWGMKFSPYPPYEILRTNDISYEEILILKNTEKVVDKYYNSRKFTNIINFLIKKWDSPFRFFYELGQYFYDKGYFNIHISNNEYYKVFLDFNMEMLREDEEPLKSIVRYDYLSFNKKRGIPDFLKSDITKTEERVIKENIKNDIGTWDNSWTIDKFVIDMEEFEKNKKVIIKNIYTIFKGIDRIFVEY